MTSDPYRVPELSDVLGAYLSRIAPAEHPELAALRARTAALPFVAVMQGSPVVGRLLQLLIGVTGARQVIEVGAFTGCSTLAMALALPPDGRIVTIDVSEEWVGIGRPHWERSGCGGRIDLRIGDATHVLQSLLDQELAGTFDLVFIDADKDRYAMYFEQALQLLRDDGVLVFDNVLFGGLVPCLDAGAETPASPQPRFMRDLHLRYAEALVAFNARLAGDPRVEIVVLPLSDGVTLARKRGLRAIQSQEFMDA